MAADNGGNSGSGNGEEKPVIFDSYRGGGGMQRKNWRWWIVGLAVLAVLIFLSRGSAFLVQWLWMDRLGFDQVFWKTFLLKLTMFGSGFLVALVFTWANIRYAAEMILSSDQSGGMSGIFSMAPLHVLRGMKTAVTAGTSLVLAFFFGSGLSVFWERLLKFVWGGTFGTADPVYNRDIGFYVFKLPLLDVMQTFLLWLSLLVLAIVVAGYASAGLIPSRWGKVPDRSWSPVRHLSLLLLVFVITLGWKFYLDRFELLYSTRGVVFGAGYTDLHVVRIGLWIMVAVSILLAAAVIYTLLVHRINIVFLGSGLYVAILVIVILLLPPLVQNFKVQPNELELEKPYLERNIEFTRKSYKLDHIEVKTYPALTDLTMKEISQNKETIDNVRLWDWRPIKQTFRQTQEIRTYYQFYNVDVDRYGLAGDKYTQVMLSARELAPELPQQAQTWVNERLQFTHGYGLAMSPVSTVTSDGLPSYLIRDLPPVTEEGLKVDQPAIYYGESTSGYRIVNTDVKEFDYPKGDKNVYTRYDGKGGIPVNGLLRRVLFAWDESEFNILLTSSIKKGSLIQIHREVAERVHNIAPFLRLDEDPYLVLADGRLYWIQDAYTVSSRYPYSEPFSQNLQYGNLNYIRNSVKVVVDAFNGTVTFYAVDPGEPVLKAYENAFPGMFRDAKEMSPTLWKHIRYPLDLFRIQVDKYTDYHMTIPQVFYNREDKWTFPNEKYAGNSVEMEPYYILIRLPEEARLEFLIMTPMTPANRDNMIAWLAARCDEPNYGQLIAYKLPKERLIYGPLQIEAMIDQDDVISQQLSLWDQRGSRVIRGNLLVIPIERSFLYVEPVYLLAEGNDIPQLRRVIVAYNQMVAMQKTLGEAITSIFGGKPTTTPEPQIIEAAPTPAPAEGVPGNLGAARETLRQAQDALQKGDWESFGRAMQKLQQQLEGKK